MYKAKVDICGVDTSKLPVLSDEEKKELLIRTKNGDEEARRKLIDGNLRLVLSVIQRFGNRRENADDLFQVGCIGLIKAVDGFNTDLDVKFSTYAVPMILGELRRYLRDYTALRVSRSMRDLAYRALSAREVLAREKGTEPTIEEIAASVGDTKEAIAEALEAITEPISLYEPVFGDGGDSVFVMDQIADNSSGDDAWLEDIALADAIRCLSEREKKIISMRFFKCRTQMEIAEEIGISQAQVSRLEKGAVDALRKRM
jgi:RNA polymerase sporulation-specific sigma factor